MSLLAPLLLHWVIQTHLSKYNPKSVSHDLLNENSYVVFQITLFAETKLCKRFFFFLSRELAVVGDTEDKTFCTYVVSVLWCNKMLSSFPRLNKTDGLQADSCNALQGMGRTTIRLVPSRLCGLFIWNQPEREQSLGWGLAGVSVGPNWTGCLVALQ